MYRVLIADDSYEDRELLKMEIARALKGTEDDIRFHEAVSVSKAKELLGADHFDLLTLDIEFDRLNEGLDALPDIFDAYPAMSIMVVSGKLDKSEVMSELFSFTKDNVLKGKRWVRHFDVLDKKDDKAEAFRNAHSFAIKRMDSAGKLRELFAEAEAFMEQGEVDKCREVYARIQEIAPGERESSENIRALKGESYEQALDYYRNGERVVAGLLLGHHIETRLKGYTRRMLGRHYPGLHDCLRELESAHRISPYKKTVFQKLLKSRNKSVHHPNTVNEDEFDSVRQNLKILEADF